MNLLALLTGMGAYKVSREKHRTDMFKLDCFSFKKVTKLKLSTNFYCTLTMYELKRINFSQRFPNVFLANDFTLQQLLLFYYQI